MQELLRYFKALGDETRLRLLDLLLTHDLCVRALAHRLGISEPAVSQHLQVLRKAGLIKGEKRGYWTHYAVERNVLKELTDRLQKIAEQPSGKAAGCDRQRKPKQTVSCRKEVKRDV